MNEFSKINDKCYFVPDFSFGIFSSKYVNNLIDKYSSIDKIINIFDNNTNINVMYHHQVLFGLILQ